VVTQHRTGGLKVAAFAPQPRRLVQEGGIDTGEPVGVGEDVHLDDPAATDGQTVIENGRNPHALRATMNRRAAPSLPRLDETGQRQRTGNRATPTSDIEAIPLRPAWTRNHGINPGRESVCVRA
jgi:hypothetical protein